MSGIRSFDVNHVGKNDIKLSFNDYHFMIDVLRDNRLTPETLLKFKHIYEEKMNGLSAILFITVPHAVAISLLLAGRAKRSHSGYQYLWPTFCFTYPFMIWRWTNYSKGSRMITEVMTDPSEDGTYVRETLRTHRPGIWKEVSEQLYKLGYEFPEINELRSNVEFPVEYVRL